MIKNAFPNVCFPNNTILCLPSHDARVEKKNELNIRNVNFFNSHVIWSVHSKILFFSVSGHYHSISVSFDLFAVKKGRFFTSQYLSVYSYTLLNFNWNW